MNSAKPPDNQGDSNGQLLPQRVAELAGELTEAESPSRRQRLARQIPELGSRTGQATKRGFQSSRDIAVRKVQAGSGVARKGAQATGAVTWHRVRASGQWLTAQVLVMAPKVPIRDIATLRSQYPGLQTEELADVLIRGAARASAGVGGAVGAAAAVPFIPITPAQLGVETLALVAIELKLIAELHEVYGRQAAGSGPQRMTAYLGSWAERRGVRVTSAGLALAVGSPLRRKLERRLLAKAGQSTLALAPLLTGAVAGALIDHRETRRLGNLVRADLRKQAVEG
jgi:hypothetical protein